jgi:hypothetical protein
MAERQSQNLERHVGRRRVAGLLVASAVTSNNSNPGPLDFFPLEEAAARVMIAELRLAE